MNAIDSPTIFIIRIDLKKISLIKSTINDIETDIINSRIHILSISLNRSLYCSLFRSASREGRINYTSNAKCRSMWERAQGTYCMSWNPIM